MSDILGKIRSGAGKVAKEADRAVDIKRIEMQIGAARKQIEEEYQKLGKMTYNSRVVNEPENPETENIIHKITELMQQIEAKEQEIKSIQEGKPATPSAPTGKKYCSNCGGENNSTSKFCNHCGAKME